MSKCPACPIAGDSPCWAEPPHRRRLCDLVAAGRADYTRLVVERTGGVEPTPSPAVPVTPSTARTPNLPSVRLAILGCDYRQAIPNCGCVSKAYCLLGKGFRPDPDAPGTVTLGECHRCMTHRTSGDILSWPP